MLIIEFMKFRVLYIYKIIVSKKYLTNKFSNINLYNKNNRF